MDEFMRNYADNVKIFRNVRLKPNCAESCGKCQIVQFRTPAPKRCICRGPLANMDGSQCP